LIHRGKYQGLIGVVIAISYAVGPLIGGALAEKVSWRVSGLDTTMMMLLLTPEPSGVFGLPFLSP
jgi:MFS family permease